MAFDKDAEDNEPLRQIELFFSTGRPRSKLESAAPPTAYIGLGSFSTSRVNGAPMITREALSYKELEAQVVCVKGKLDALLAEAKARFRLASEAHPSVGG
jgi:hypothetical protein